MFAWDLKKCLRVFLAAYKLLILWNAIFKFHVHAANDIGASEAELKQVNECLVFIGGGRKRIARSPRIIYEISGDYGKRDSDAEWLAPKSDYYAAHNNARAYTSY